MVRVAPINLAYNPRTLWFDPGDFEIKKNDPVVVETARGIEFGYAAKDIIEVSDAEVEELKSPLKPVVRIATPEDVEKAKELERLSREALPAFKEMAAETHSEMHPVSVEFLFDGDKAIFYFEAEDRIDFRELVRRLAAHFKVRIDMRQIGVRDEARIVGGLGHCGQELCCKRMGGEFCPVSIRMAKEQDLSLNPQKISGLCGRLMCCLRYEYDAYKDFKSRAPKANATIQTPAGPAKVVELDVPREIVSLKVGDEKPVKVPLADFEPAEEGARPTTVGVAAWELATSEEARENRGDALTFLTSQFTGSDKLAEKGSVRRSGNAKRAGQTEASEPSASSKRSGQSSRKSRAAQPEPVVETRKPRRRRSTKIADGEVVEKTQAVETPAETPAERGEKKPSRRSRNRSQSAAGAQVSEGSKQSSTRESAGGEGKSSKEQGAKNPTRRSRNRGRGEKDAKGGVAVNEKVESVKTAPRPGQKSSGLRGAEGAPAPQKNGSEAASEEKAARRRPRRRTRSKANGAAETQGGSE